MSCNRYGGCPILVAHHKCMRVMPLLPRYTSFLLECLRVSNDGPQQTSASSVLQALSRTGLPFFNSSHWSQAYFTEILQWLPRMPDSTASNLLTVLEESCE